MIGIGLIIKSAPASYIEAANAHKVRAEALGCTADDFNLVLSDYQANYYNPTVSGDAFIYHQKRVENIGCTVDNYEFTLNEFLNNY